MFMKYIKFLFLIHFLLSVDNHTVYSQKLTIEDAVFIALENNQDIKTAKINVAKEEAIVVKSFNIPKPQLFIEFEGVKGSINNFESRKIGVSQDLEFPSVYFFRANVQNSQVNIAKMELNKLAYQIRYEVESAYLKVVLNNELLKIAKENLKLYDDFLYVAGKKYEAGSASNLEVLGAKVSKIKYENQVKSLESEIVNSKSELRKLLNVSYFEYENLDGLSYKPFFINKDDIMNLTIKNNPALKIIKYKKEKFNNKLSLSKSEFLPSLSFKYYKQKIGSENDFWGVEFGIGIPLWFWWEQTGNIKESSYEIDISHSEESSMKTSLTNEVNIFFEEYLNSTREVQFFNDEALFESNEILRQSKISYEEGAIDYVEYLQSLQLVYETKSQYVNSLYNYNNSIIKLKNLIAGEFK